jgi:class 3 adenylate cyclase
VSELPTGTITFLFTDIAGSTKLWEEHPTAMKAALARHDACLRAAIETHRGHIFKTIGDEFCAAFAQATDALRAALAAQQSLHASQPSAAPTAAEREVFLKVKMALHTGAAELREGDYHGSSLNRTARLLAAARGGQVLLSRATQELVQDDLPPAASLKYLGPYHLRDLQRLVQVFQLVHPDLPFEFPPFRAAPVIPAELSREELLDLLFNLHRRLEAQKQHCAFLSVDVVHHSEMNRAGTPLTTEYSFGQYQRWVNEVVQRWGGQTTNTAGDGVMCLFPSDTQALRAARQLQEELSRFDAEHNRLPQPFRIRCGVSAGEVAVGGGEAIGQLQSVVIDRAAALQKRAEPGGILVSGEVAATALIELGPVTPLDEPIGGEPAFAFQCLERMSQVSETSQTIRERQRRE